MSKRSIVRGSDGKPTHVDITSNDGSTTVRREARPGMFGETAAGKAVEVTDHHEDGSSTPYVAGQGLFGEPNRARKK